MLYKNLEQTRFVTLENIAAGSYTNDVLEVAKALGITDKEMCNILGISTRKLHNKSRVRDKKDLGKNISERLLRLRELILLAVNYFGGEDSAKCWFNTPNIGLGNQRPIFLCDTFFGMSLVENSLLKLMHGMTA